MAGYQGTSTRNNDEEALAAVIEAERRDMHTSLPGKVVSYGAGQTVSITPALTQTFGDRTLSAPTLQNVPVLHPRGGGFGVHIPLKEGDPMTLIFSSRSRDAFQESGGNMSNAPGRMNDLSDAVAFPGGTPDNTSMTGIDPQDFFAGSDDGRKGTKVTPAGSVSLTGGPSGTDKIIVTPDGKVDIKSENGESLMQIIREALILFKSHLNLGAPMDAPYQEATQKLINRLDGMKA